MPPNKTNKKAVTPIVITASVVIVAVITLIVFLLLPRDDNALPNTVSSSSGEIIKESNIIKMPDCVNTKLDDSRKNLEGLALIVEEKYEYSEDVAKDLVIKQSVEAGSQVKSGSTVTLTVSKGYKPNPYDYDQKLTVSAASGSSAATATLYEWKNGDWSELAEYDATVGENGIGTTREGSKISPEGTHKLGIVLTKGDASTKMETYTITPYTGVVFDTESPYYNQIIENPNGVDSDTFDSVGNEIVNAMIFIEFNGNGFSSEGVTPGAGSAIFLRGKSGSLSATHGDVDISASDMDDLLSRLDPDKNPVIELTAGE